MTFEQLVAAARKAIADGNAVLAAQYTAQAKAIKGINDVAELASLRDFKAGIVNEPAHNKGGYLTVTQDETDKAAKEQFPNLGEQLKAIHHAAYNPGDMDFRLKAQKAVGLGANEGQQSDGGFLIQNTFMAGIKEKMHAESVLASRCDSQTVGANANGLKINVLDETSRATGSRWGGIRGYWVAEAGTLTASQPRFKQMEWNLKKLAALLYVTSELLQDTTALAGRAQTWAAKELSFLRDDAILNGGGAGTPLGILSSTALVSVAKETGQAAATLVYNNIVKMWARMWAPARAKAVWFINQDIESQLYLMDFPVGTGGVPVFLPPGGASTSPYSTLFGRPVIATEFNATLGTVGDIVLADMSEYLLIEKGGVRGDVSIHVQFLTDQEAYRWIMRLDGQPMWQTPLTPFKGTATLSPFVALDSRA